MHLPAALLQALSDVWDEDFQQAFGARLAFLYRSGEVLHQESVNGRVEIRVRLAQDIVDRLRAEGVEVEG